ncbi:MAG TPA: PilZ domain-containing protein [Moraxellaceae bacterium]|nr:PilZ domain-containing protein [Moraxellaceae bacterium]
MDQAPPDRAVRLRLQQFLPVVERHTREPLGRMVDLSITGMMLIATQELPVGQIFEIEIRTPEGHPVPPVQLVAESVWCRTAPNNPRHFGVGFRFQDESAAAQPLLEQLMLEAGTRH